MNHIEKFTSSWEDFMNDLNSDPEFVRSHQVLMNMENAQLRAVCRYLRGEVERLEAELEEQYDAIEGLWETAMGEEV